MPPRPDREWKTLDNDLRRQTFLEHGAFHVVRPLAGAGLAFIFIAASMVVSAVMSGGSAYMPVLLAASAFAGYFALNVGANDIANSMGPAVGAGAIRVVPALLLAAVAESAGALLAGRAVVSTVAWGIIPPELVPEPAALVRIMLSAMIAAGLWVNVATLISAPVSTSHSLVGGVLGAGVAALGPSAVSWGFMSAIAVGWMATPVVAGVLAATLLALINRLIMDREDRTAAAILWVPRFVGLMTGTFAAFLLIDVLAPGTRLSDWPMLLLAAAMGVGTTLVLRPRIARTAASVGQRRRAIRGLFSTPLVVAAVLFSFGHGANDVSNAIGPLAAIFSVLSDGGEYVPGWEMLIGAFGISLGVVLFGPKLIRVVGSEITRLNPARSFCVLLAAGVTVIAATLLGLPVSSTHTAIGGIFGVGFYREWREARMARHLGAARAERPPREERARRRLVRRSHMTTIVAAWMVTVPVSAVGAALICVLFSWLI